MRGFAITSLGILTAYFFFMDFIFYNSAHAASLIWFIKQSGQSADHALLVFLYDIGIIRA